MIVLVALAGTAWPPAGVALGVTLLAGAVVWLVRRASRS